MIASWTTADTALREKLWAGSVPIKIDLSLNDVASIESPKPMYVLANRMTYFAALLKDIKRHFDASAPPSSNSSEQTEIWLDFKNIPLNWYKLELVMIIGTCQ